MAWDSAKGLLNPVGENNCFLNSAVQVLWHLDTFRRNFRLLSGHACMGPSCIFCALKVMLTQFQYSSCSVLPPSHLRQALARSFAGQQRYQLGRMDDASECFENILLRLHRHLAHDVDEDSCQAPHCIPHQKFSMTVVEQALCQCGATAEPFCFTEFVHYVSTTAMTTLFSPAVNRASRSSFGQLLNHACNDDGRRTCPKSCGGVVTMRRTLTNAPEVVSIGLVWDSERPTFEHISDVLRAIDTVLHPADMFYSVIEADWAASTKFQLVGLVCYYGHHYSTFFFHSKMKIWILFDDSHVKKLGPSWRSVAELCAAGRYQPLLLLYANPNVEPIDVSSAPDGIIRIAQPPPSSHGCQRDDRSSRHRGCTDPNNLRLPVSATTPSQCFTSSPAVTGECNQMTATSRWMNRQPSYLSAVSRGDEIGYRDTGRAAHCQDVQIERRGMYSIAENEEFQPRSSSTGYSAIHQESGAESEVADSRRTKTDAETVGRGRFGSQTDLWEWCKKSATDGGAADIGTYIRRDDVRKLLKLRGQKMPAASTAYSSIQSSSALGHGPVTSRGTFGLRPDIQNGAAAGNPSSGVLHPFSAGSHQGLSSVNSHELRPNSDALDSVSVGSHKDSGYRSEEDRHSGEYSSNSPKLSASNSTVSLSTCSNCVDPTKHSDVRSFCSSFESLCSVQSLPVAAETCLRTVPEGPLRSKVSQGSSDAAKLRHQAQEFFVRSARTADVGGHWQPMRADHSAAVNSKYRASCASGHRMEEFTDRPVSVRHLVPEFPGTANSSVHSCGVRHAASMPTINQMSESDAVVDMLDCQSRRTSATPSCRYVDNTAIPGGQPVLRHHDVSDNNQSKSTASRRVQARGYFRDTGAILPSRQTPASKPSDSRRPVFLLKKPPWK